ncbi:MAG: branched-chain amino acid ABC transporter permease [Rubellimicrobium sp.]|nr:branched-chain amino acid ABC transporter permease [Rubellimicrobium sp.]
MTLRNILLFAGVGLLFVLTGFLASWNQSLLILNLSLVSAIMAMGVNLQWGYAGLFNTGIMGFAAMGGLAVVLTSAKRQPDAFAAGGMQILLALLLAAAVIVGTILMRRRMKPGRARNIATVAVLVAGFVVYRMVFDPAVNAVEAVNPAAEGSIGGLGLNSLWGWVLGAFLAAGTAWLIGKTALGLRSDYLAIATLGIAEIIIQVLKNEEWLARGVKMVNDLPRPWPVPREVDLQRDPGFLEFVATWGFDPVTTSTVLVKIMYAVLLLIVLAVVIWLSERALNSPWGRMMRAIRDNEVAAAAMGKDVTRRHLQIFVLGSALAGVGGAMLVSMDSLMNPGTYNPLRYTFLIWVMVVVGGSGNNWGSLLGSLLIGWLYLIVEQVGPTIMGYVISGMEEGALRKHLIDSAAHLRLLSLGVILLLVLRFSPRGLIPEK